MSPIILQNGGTVLKMWPTAIRPVNEDGSLGPPMWYIEVLRHGRHPDWEGSKASHTQEEMFRIKQAYLDLGYKIVSSTMPVSGSAPTGPEGPLG